ncbi:MAG: IS3 family transposase [Chlorobiaceae bacterium]|nr:IS3 family transposase [Chlorobiaceae bacterium]
MVEKEHTGISMQRQCDLLSIHRSGLYYQPRTTSKLNRELMRLIDEQYLLRPYYGVYRMWQWLTRDKGYKINLKRVRRLYRLMGLEAIGPKPNTSKPAPGHKVYPYLLRGLEIEHSDHVWATDITYVPMAHGFMYLMAVIDLKSRYVLNWSVSNTMDAKWCAEVFLEAVRMHGAPKILNTDQGSQFTSEVFTEAVVKTAESKLSMDGKGRAIDNVFIERLWRSVKYEYLYLNPPADGLELYKGLKHWFNDYNKDRRHTSLYGEVPETVYFAKKPQATEAA